MLADMPKLSLSLAAAALLGGGLGATSHAAAADTAATPDSPAIDRPGARARIPGPVPNVVAESLPRADDLRGEGTHPLADAGLDAVAVPEDRRRRQRLGEAPRSVADAAARDHGQRERHEREVRARVHARRKDLREGRRTDGDPLHARREGALHERQRSRRRLEGSDGPGDEHRAGRARARALARGRRRHAHDDHQARWRRPPLPGHQGRSLSAQDARLVGALQPRPALHRQGLRRATTRTASPCSITRSRR